MKIVIDRSTVILPNEIVGIMFIDGIPRFVTLENRHKAIPPGTYTAKRDMHYGKPGDAGNYEVWELQNVPGRTQIQIHIGNEWDDSKGCILIGERFFYQALGVKESKNAYETLMKITKDETEIEVEII